MGLSSCKEMLNLQLSLMLSLVIYLTLWTDNCASKVDGETNNNSFELQLLEFFDEELCKPQQVHLSFGDSVNEVNVIWATKAQCTSEVKFGTHPWGIESVAKGQYLSFTEQNAEGMQHLYRVKLTKLLPEQTYYYIPVSNDSYAGPFYFQAPKQGNDWSPKFLMFGDLGIHSHTIPFLTEEALSGEYAAIFHVGDFAYDMKDQNGVIGDYFMKLIEPIASSIPYMTCPGNHEIDFQTFSNYRHRFAMPGSDWPISLDKMWYSIDIGPVHFVSYSTEVFFINDGHYEDGQKMWLKQDLLKANQNREKTPWVIAYGHRPMYCSTRIGDDCSLPYSLVREGLEDIFYGMSVDVVIQAHEHNYERLWPHYKGEVTNKSYIDPSVPIQIITGAAGSKESFDPFLSDNLPDWSAFRLDQTALNSYGYLHVINFTHAFWEQRAIKNHTTLDRIWIVKKRNFTLSFGSDTGKDKSQDALNITKSPVYAIIAFVVSGLVILLVLWVRILVRHYRKKDFENQWNQPALALKSNESLPMNADSAENGSRQPLFEDMR